MKTAIIGAGRMGRRHIVAAKLAGANVVAICDVCEASLLEAQKEGLPADACYTDAAEMLHSVRPEVVIVATTAPSHAELVCLAAESRAKYILCEKPFAVSLAQAEHMTTVCRSRSVRLAINHQMRYMEQYARVKEIAFSDALGGLESVTVLGGNMGMAMNGLHYFEMFRYLTDSFPTVAQAWFDPINVPNPRGPQFADKAGQIRVENTAGQRLYMDIGSRQGHGLLVTYECVHGHIVVDELEGAMTVTHRKEEHRNEPSTRYGMPWQRYELKITPADAVLPSAAVLKALLHGTDWPDAECGLAAMRALVAGYMSDERGTIPVRVDDQLPRDREFPWA